MDDMVNLEIEEINHEKDLLIRSCQVKINGNTITTPTRTIGTTLVNTFEFQEAKPLIGNNFRPFGEVYIKVTLTELGTYIDDDDKGKKFSRKYQIK